MHPLRKQKLQIIIVVLALLAIAAGLMLYALRQNISLYYSPTQMLTQKVALKQTFRLGGLVQKGSIQRLQGLTVRFKVTDFKHTVTVQYTGVLPDLFRDNQGVVVDGYLASKNLFIAKQVLAKHDENYMPPQVAKMLQ